MASENYDFVKTHSNSAGPYKGQFIDEQSYLDYISQFQGSDWYNQFLNAYNTYKSQSFNPNWFQQLGYDMFGDSRAWDNFENTRLSSFWDTFGRITDAMHQENYSLPSEELARRKAAGINDDLSGGNAIGSGSPGNIDQAEMAVPSLNDGSNMIQDISNVGQTIISTALQLYSGFQSIRGADLDNLSKSLGLSGSITDEAWRVIKEGSSEFWNGLNYTPGSSIDVLFKDGKVYEPLVQAISNRIDKLPYNRRIKRGMKKSIDSLIFSMDDEGNKSFSSSYQTLMNNLGVDLFKSRSEFTKSSGEIGSDQESQLAMRFIGHTIYRPLNDLMLEVSRLQSQNNSAYLKEINPTLKAQSENSEFELKIGLKSIKNRLTKTFEDINKKITGSYDLSPAWKLALQAGVTSAEAFALSKILKFD